MKGRYILLTQHGAERKQRRIRFDTFDAAKEFAIENDPDTDSSICPTLDEDLIEKLGDRYEQGQFWFGNRYGVIYRAASK